MIPKAEPGGSVPVAAAASLARWPCPACTFANPGNLYRCELCETPKPEITPTQAAAADDEIEFVREIKVTSNRRVRRSSGNATGSAPAPKPKRPRTARVKREPGTAAVTTAAVTTAAVPPPRRAAQVAARNARRAAEAEADGELSGSESDFNGAGEEEEDEDDEDEDEELETEGEEDAEDDAEGDAGATRAREPARVPRSRRAPAPRVEREPRTNRRLPAESESEEEEEDITFQGGLRLPSGTYARLLEHQRTSIKWLWELHCQRAGGIIGDEMGLGKTVQVSAFLALWNAAGCTGRRWWCARRRC
jgi:DNA excision repair protein ERCC-6